MFFSKICIIKIGGCTAFSCKLANNIEGTHTDKENYRKKSSKILSLFITISVLLSTSFSIILKNNADYIQTSGQPWVNTTPGADIII